MNLLHNLCTKPYYYDFSISSSVVLAHDEYVLVNNDIDMRSSRAPIYYAPKVPYISWIRSELIDNSDFHIHGSIDKLSNEIRDKRFLQYEKLLERDNSVFDFDRKIKRFMYLLDSFIFYLRSLAYFSIFSFFPFFIY